MKKKIFKLLIFTIICSSCEKSYKIDTNTVFRYNEHKNINSLDPIFAKDIANIWAVNQLYNGLVEMDKNLNVIPSIAKKWEISEDAKTYTFIIDTTIKFHAHKLLKHRNVTAHDFEYSFNRLINPELASPGGWVLENVKKFYAQNDTVFKIELNNPFNSFLGILTMKYCSVVPKKIVEFYGNDFRSNPVGTGPFKFKRWEENIKLVLRKNLDYFEKDSIGNKLPYFESVSVTFLPEKQSEFLQLVKGNIDFISGLDNSYKDNILNNNGGLNKSYQDRINMLRGPFLNTEYLAFFSGSNQKEIKSPLIRKAINIGFDKEKMVKFLRNGIGKAGNGGFIPKGMIGHNSKSLNIYNPDNARKLVDIYKRTNGTPKIELTTSSNYLILCEFIQKELENIGIQISINVIPGSSLKQAKANGKLDFFRASWIADYPDAENYMALFYSKNFSPNGPNYTHFKNENFDKLYEKMIKETDQSERVKMYKKMDSIVISKSIIVPLYYDEVTRFVSKNIKGMEITATNLLDLRRVYKED